MFPTLPPAPAPWLALVLLHVALCGTPPVSGSVSINVFLPDVCPTTPARTNPRLPYNTSTPNFSPTGPDADTLQESLGGAHKPWERLLSGMQEEAGMGLEQGPGFVPARP